MLGQAPFAQGHGYGMGVAVVMEPEQADVRRCRGGVGTIGWPRESAYHVVIRSAIRRCLTRLRRARGPSPLGAFHGRAIERGAELGWR